MTRIEEFGWNGGARDDIARVVSAHGDYYHLVCNAASGEILARKKKSSFARACETGAQLPMTGDFVRFRRNECGDSLILEVMPRFSSFARKDPAARRKSQVLAVNFDTLAIMMAPGADFSPARVGRFLDLAVDVGDASLLVILSKADLSGDAEEGKMEALASAVAGRARVLRMSALTGEGVDEVREYAKPRRTIALVGSSGVGKSTLLNTLAGGEWAATQEIQSWSGRGRHTTTSRELVMLPSGAMVLDTPGVREVGMFGETDRILQKGESSHRYRK